MVDIYSAWSTQISNLFSHRFTRDFRLTHYVGHKISLLLIYFLTILLVFASWGPLGIFELPGFPDGGESTRILPYRIRKVNYHTV